MSKYKSVTVFAPASVANLGSGFDVFGMAIEGPGDIVRIERNDKKSLRIRGIKGDKGALSKEAEQNTAGVALMAFLKEVASDFDFDIWIEKQMPLGSGMGSSAASAVAAVYAANVLLGSPLKKKDLVPLAMEGEMVASGSAHADNIAPSMLGGFTLIRSMDPFEVISLPVPKGLHIALVHPHIHLKTSDARAVLPKNVSLKSAIAQWANTAGLVAGIYENDIDLIGRAMKDFIVEPARKSLIPHFDAVTLVAFEHGASGCSISGAGPSVVALCKSKSIAKNAGEYMQKVYTQHKIKSDLFLTRADEKGVRVLDKK